jgi:hypothetical protein
MNGRRRFVHALSQTARYDHPVNDPGTALNQRAAPDVAGRVHGDRRLPPALGRRAFLSFFVLWWLVAGAWAIATPIWGSPDEFDHATRAYAAVRGEVFVPPAAARRGTGGFVDAPAGWVNSIAHFRCYAFNSSKTADCLPPLTNDATPVRFATGAARYNPVYYLIVGTASLIMSPAHALWGMRLISAALSAFFLTWAFTSAAASLRPIIATCTVALATTPMVGFLAASVNPNGLEISAAISTWVNGFLALTASEDSRRTVFVRRAAISAIAVVSTRALSPLWIAVIAVILAIAVASREHLLRLARISTRWTAAVLLAMVAALAWTYLAKTLLLNVTTKPAAFSFAARLRLAWGGYPKQLFLWRGTVGMFGWLDTAMPLSTVQLWTVAVVLLVLLAVLVSPLRGALAIMALSAAVVVLPTYLEAVNWNTSGPVWQPRYTMPISLGIVLIAGLLLAESRRWPVARRAQVVLGTVLCVAASWTNLDGFVVAISRYAVGAGKAISLTGAWNPPVPAGVLVAAEALAWVLLSVLALASGFGRSPSAVMRPGQPFAHMSG